MTAMTDETIFQGLSEQEARERLAKEGFNELPSAKRRSFLHLLWGVVREPMFLMLIACGGLYLALGDPQEALMLIGFVIVIIGITFFQERKTERALEALRDLSSPRALVIRDGRQQRIAGREVVRDDIVLVSEGDRIPADARLLVATNLSVDESLLTGESMPVSKKSWDDDLYSDHKNIRPGGDDLPIIYSGTLAVKGQAVACITATGAGTEIGKIGKALQILEPEDTNLQRQTGKIVRTFAIIGVGLCLLIIIVYGLTHGNWLEGILAGITLAMAMLPEEFPVVLTIFLALGAWRISLRQVLTRRVPAVEMLGAATVLCVDKTGTLTLNRMTVTKLAVHSETDTNETFEVEAIPDSLPDRLHEVVEYSILASPSDPFDPMEKAMKELGGRTLFGTEHIHKDWILQREYPLSPKMLAMSRVWKSPDGNDFIIAAKGAPEAIASLCHHDTAQHTSLLAQIERMTSHGLRVIAVARATFHIDELPEHQHDFAFEYLGLLGLADPVRPGVREALQDCYTAGIRVIMITGDYPGTACNIASQIGLQPADQIITGPELDAMNDVDLQERIRTTCIFARVVPEQKLRLVKALKANGEVVAMTGDGVNDAPALKAANIGIAMGGWGTDVAREAASLVLLDDNFASIVAAVRMGRRIFDNLKKAMAFIFSVHIPIAGLSLIPVLLDWPLALLPVHILFLELIIDPACTIVFEMESDEPGIMDKPPRKLNAPLFGRSMLLIGLIQGLGILAVVVGIYAFALNQHLSAEEARMFAFVSLVIGNLGLIFANRSHSHSMLETLRKPNKAFWLVCGGAVFFLITILALPGMRTMFQFAPLHRGELILLLIAGVTSILIAESIKIGPLKRFIFDSVE